VWYAFFDNNPGVLWRALLGLAATAMAWRLARQRRIGEAGFLVAFAASVVLDAVGLLPSATFLHDRTPQALGVLAGVAALGAGLVLAVRRRLTRRRAAAVLTVLLLAVLYPHRGVLGDPASAVLVFSAPMVILFGLTWRILTDAEFTRSGSRRFPQSTRVLLFLANSLFACTSVAFLALARGTGTDLDTSNWATLGSDQLGDALFLVALLAGAWLALRGPVPSGSPDDPDGPPAQYTREVSAMSAPASEPTKPATVDGLENIG
ncbi:MAG: hypothetical protein AAGC63_02630, partial [Propionicimonas sp.]|nr:hypothetical protein [Propionicimonas sp.]